MLDVGIAYTFVLPISQYRPDPGIDQAQVTTIGPMGLEYLEKRKLFLFSPIGSKKPNEQAPRLAVSAVVCPREQQLLPKCRPIPSSNRFCWTLLMGWDEICATDSSDGRNDNDHAQRERKAPQVGYPG